MDINTYVNDQLINMIDAKYKTFSEKIANSPYELLGIRIPNIRKVAKAICRELDIVDFLDNYKCNYFEEYMLYGIVMASGKMEESTRKRYIYHFLEKLKDWSICDSVCASFKLKKCKQDYFNFLMDIYNNSNKYENEEFVIRFVIVMFMDHYLDEEYIPDILMLINKIDVDYYYTNMAMAWLISCVYIRYNDRGYAFLLDDKLNKFTHNKSISKICDSYRIDKVQKEKVKKLRRK